MFSKYSLINLSPSKKLSRICPVWTSASSRFSEEIFWKWDKCTLIVIINDYNSVRRFRDSFFIILLWVIFNKKRNINRKKPHRFFSRRLIFNLQQKVLKFTNLHELEHARNWPIQETDILNLENRSFENVSFLSRNYLTIH